MKPLWKYLNPHEKISFPWKMLQQTSIPLKKITYILPLFLHILKKNLGGGEFEIPPPPPAEFKYALDNNAQYS